jgi:hypothetical protein
MDKLFANLRMYIALCSAGIVIQKERITGKFFANLRDMYIDLCNAGIIKQKESVFYFLNGHAGEYSYWTGDL